MTELPFGAVSVLSGTNPVVAIPQVARLLTPDDEQSVKWFPLTPVALVCGVLTL